MCKRRYLFVLASLAFLGASTQVIADSTKIEFSIGYGFGTHLTEDNEYVIESFSLPNLDFFFHADLNLQDTLYIGMITSAIAYSNFIHFGDIKRRIMLSIDICLTLGIKIYEIIVYPEVGYTLFSSERSDVNSSDDSIQYYGNRSWLAGIRIDFPYPGSSEDMAYNFLEVRQYLNGIKRTELIFGWKINFSN